MVNSMFDGLEDVYGIPKNWYVKSVTSHYTGPTYTIELCHKRNEDSIKIGQGNVLAEAIKNAKKGITDDEI